MKVLVTGGNGFIGSVVVRALLAGKHHVRCLLRKKSKTERIEGLPYERIEGDVRDATAVRAAMEGCGAAIHLAGLSAWNEIDSPLMDEVVQGGTRHVLDAARSQPEGERPRVVYVSSASAIAASSKPEIFDETAEYNIPDRLNYARCKHRAEAICLAAARDGVPVVIVNPGEVYGPNDTGLVTACNLVDFAKSSPVMVCNGGISVVHVEDVAQGIVSAMERGRSGERYILSGERLTLRQFAALTLEILGQKKAIMTVPNPVIEMLAWLGRASHLPLPFNAHVIPYATRYWFTDSSKAQRELGVKFRSARETLAPTLQWLKETGRITAPVP
jgi:dihydroflavonol-4-reductase